MAVRTNWATSPSVFGFIMSAWLRTGIQGRALALGLYMALLLR